MYLKNSESELVGSRNFSLSKSLWGNCYTIVLTGVMVKPHNEINYVLVECYSFIKSLIQMKGCLFMIYIQ